MEELLRLKHEEKERRGEPCDGQVNMWDFRSVPRRRARTSSVTRAAREGERDAAAASDSER